VAVIFGIDPGKAPDRFAMCAVEEAETEIERDGTKRREITYLVRALERTPLGTSYPKSIARFVEVFDAIAAMTHAGDDLRVRTDNTGVGSPVTDLVREALESRRRAKVTAVTFTSTDRVERPKHGEMRVGKAFLVSRLQVLLQQRLVKLPATKEAKALARELADYEIHAHDSGITAGAFKTGAHDDLVTALALACLEWEKPRAVPTGLAAANASGRGGSYWRGVEGGSTRRSVVAGPTPDWALPTKQEWLRQQRERSKEEEPA
jgi:hypothetical protein